MADALLNPYHTPPRVQRAFVRVGAWRHVELYYHQIAIKLSSAQIQTAFRGVCYVFQLQFVFGSISELLNRLFRAYLAQIHRNVPNVAAVQMHVDHVEACGKG